MNEYGLQENTIITMHRQENEVLPNVALVFFAKPFRIKLRWIFPISSVSMKSNHWNLDCCIYNLKTKCDEKLTFSEICICKPFSMVTPFERVTSLVQRRSRTGAIGASLQDQKNNCKLSFKLSKLHRCVSEMTMSRYSSLERES